MGSSCARRLGVALAFVLASAAFGQPQRPQVYVWSDYTHKGVPFDPRFVPVVAVDIAVNSTPAAIAQHAVRQILERKTVASPATIDDKTVAILMRGLGVAAGCSIHRDPADIMRIAPGWPYRVVNCGQGLRITPWPEPCSTTAAYVRDLYNSPWTTHGRAKVKAWMEQFIGAYKALQAASPPGVIPDPCRFFFDYETWPVVGGEMNSTAKMLWMIADPRWESEGIPGYPSPKGGLMSLSQIYGVEREAWGLPEDPLDAFDHDFGLSTDCWPNTCISNPTFYLWFSRVMTTSIEGAFKDVAYDPIHEGWGQTVQTGSYVLSAGTDGSLSTVDFWGRPSFYGIVSHTTAGAWGYRYAGRTPIASLNCLSWTSFADQLSPTLATAYPDALLPGETRWDATLRIARYNIESLLFSRGNAHRPLVPWVQMVGIVDSHYSWAQNTDVPHTITRGNARDLFALMRAYDVPEVFLFDPGVDPVNWPAEKAAFTDAYSVVVSGYVPERGTERDNLLSDYEHETSHLWHTQDGGARIVANQRKEASIRVDLDGVPAGNDHGLRLNIEMSSNVGGGHLSVWVRLADSPDWARLGRIDVPRTAGSTGRNATGIKEGVNAAAGDVFLRTRVTLPSTLPYLDRGTDRVRLWLSHNHGGHVPPTSRMVTSFGLVQGVLVDATPGAVLARQNRADYTDDGLINGNDAAAFEADYWSGRLSADLDENGFLDARDYSKFYTDYVTRALDLAE